MNDVINVIVDIVLTIGMIMFTGIVMILNNIDDLVKIGGDG